MNFSDLPRIGQGTWRIEADDRAAMVASLRAGVDAGLTHIDTAELYGGGYAEEVIAEAVGDRRDQLFLVSKVMPSNASRRGTVAACEKSLKRLRTDHLDCYLLHWPGSEPLEETFAGFEDLRAAGKIKSYGVSNFDEDLLREAVRTAGAGKIACNQVLYNLAERHIESKLVPACRALGISVVGYSPFMDLKETPALREVAAELSASTRQVALAFLARVALQIPKAADPAHVRDNAGALHLKLSAAQVARLEQAYPLKIRRQLPTA
jgi:diketogulonate reductase-like aldo/keto reductase